MRNKLCKFTEEQELYMVQQYESGKSTVQIAKEFENTGASTVAAIVKRHIGLLRNSSTANRKYRYDYDYFSSINEESKAYWLGVIYADGYMTESKKSFGLSCSVDDIEHLTKFKNTINAENPIRTYTQSKSSYTGGNNKVSRIELGGPIYDQLIALGVVPHKTSILKPPNINNDMARHFIRGYFDGDGCITNHIPKKKVSETYKVSFLGTKEMLDFIRDYIEENTTIRIRKYYIRKDSSENNYTLEIHGNLQVKQFLDLLYQDASVFLDRKYDKYCALCKQHSRLYQ